MFSLAGSCEVFFTLLYCLLDLRCGDCNVISLYFCVALLMDLFVFVFVNCLVKQFIMFLVVVVILLLNVMEVLSVRGGVLLDRPCMVFQIMRVLFLWYQCTSICSFHRFCLCVSMSEVISAFRSLKAGAQLFVLLMLFLCVILHTMWSGKSLQLICILPFGILCLTAIRMMFVKIILAVYMLVGIVV